MRASSSRPGSERDSSASAGMRYAHPWRDGSTHVVFDLVEFLGRLAVLVLVPRPRINLILYHGVLGPRAAWRPEVVGGGVRGGGDGAGLRAGRRGGPRGVGSATRARPVVGGAHGTHLRVGRVGVSSVWRTAPVDRPHRGGRRHRPDSAPPRSADHDPRAASSPPTATRSGYSRPAPLGRRHFGVRRLFLTIHSDGQSEFCAWRRRYAPVETLHA